MAVDPQPDHVQRVRDFGVPSSEWDFLSNLSPDITGQHTQDPERFNVDKTQVLGKGRRNKTPLLRMKLSELVSARKEDQFSLRACHWAHQPHSRAGPRNSWPAQNEFHFFVQFLFCFSINFLLVCHLIFLFLLVFLEMRHEVD